MEMEDGLAMIGSPQLTKLIKDCVQLQLVPNLLSGDTGPKVGANKCVTRPCSASLTSMEREQDTCTQAHVLFTMIPIQVVMATLDGLATTKSRRDLLTDTSVPKVSVSIQLV